MKDIILKKALSTITNLNLDIMVAIINATGNPTNAALMLLNEYVAPVLGKHALPELHSPYQHEVISDLTLTEYSPLSNPDNSVMYSGKITTTIYFREGDTEIIEKYKTTGYCSHRDNSSKPTEEFTTAHSFTAPFLNAYCSLSHWQKYMLKDVLTYTKQQDIYTDAD